MKMALIQCPECNQQISDQAASCPHCGMPLQGEPKQNKVTKKSGMSNKKLFGIACAIAIPLVLIIFASILIPKARTTKEIGDFYQLNARVFVFDKALIIHNNDVCDWTDVFVYIDPEYKYSYFLGDIARLDKRTVMMDDFATQLGEKPGFGFNKVLVTIHCKTPYGLGEWSRSFKKY